MNTQTQEALKMAISALKDARHTIFSEWYEKHDAAINACKEALKLEERTQRTMHCGTADAFIAMDDEHKRRWFVQSLRDSQRRKELEEALESQEQEHCCPECGCHFTGEFPFNYECQEPVASQMSEQNKMVMLQPNGIVYENNDNSWHFIGRLIKDVDALCEEYYNRGKRCAHPAQPSESVLRRPLSDDDMSKVFDQFDWKVLEIASEHLDLFKFARAIEKAHGIGGSHE